MTTTSSLQNGAIPAAGLRAPGRLFCVGSVLCTLAALVLFGVAYALMWVPVYFSNDGDEMMLFPVALVVLLAAGVFAVAAIGCGVLALAGMRTRRRGKMERGLALVSLAVSGALFVMGLPVIFMGNLPLVMFG